ncbi:amidohydrolase [Hymenobacter roseosalivarius DSM 11622]|uniref:Amidohydrolase n=2 Tax=Hymenobacter roseosalivarius TaxID=89967 RepID=A0A1W1VJH3_9BACT|nr:amidohydrolase [Hymenobacter roseosalivarius DSM 11622]
MLLLSAKALLPKKMLPRFVISRRPALLLVFFLLSLVALAQHPARPLARPRVYVRTNPASPAWELRNGQWFDGKRFQKRVFYVKDGLLQRSRPAHVDTVVDLRGQWVIPPFAEAHTHMLDGTRGLPAMIEKYLREGVYYVQVLTNSRRGAEAARPFLNQPRSVDAVYANGGLTSTLGHPFMAYEPRAMGFYDYTQWKIKQDTIAKSRLMENDAYWFLDSLPDLNAKWPRILAGRPDLLKIYLLDAKNYERTRRSGQLGDKGLRPDIAAEIVRRAHAAGLRVFAHVETADDFRLGVRLGVDGFAHAPNYGGRDCPDPADCYLTAADLRAAGRRGIMMTPTVWIGYNFTPADSSRLRRHQTAQRELLRNMVRSNVAPLVGADWYGETPVGEALAWEKLGAFDHGTLLRLWTETTARAIFPSRRIGRLAPGYEASLLVLGQNPLLDFPAAVRDIRLRVKQGERLPGPPADRAAQAGTVGTVQQP